MAPTNPQKFLIHSLSSARSKEIGILTNDEILKAFPPKDLMQGFKDMPERRADVSQLCVGTKRGTALKQSIESAAENLLVALHEKDTSADEIFSVVTIEELVLLQDPVRIWKLIYENGWLALESDENKRYMAQLFGSILDLKLFGTNTWLAMVHKIGYKHFVSDRVPLELRAMMLELVITNGEPSLHKNVSESVSVTGAKGNPFTAKDLLGVMEPEFLSKHVALKVLASVLEELASTMSWVKPIKNESEAPPPPAVPKPSPEAPEIIQVPPGPDTGSDGTDADLDALLAADEGRTSAALVAAPISVPPDDDEDDSSPTTIGKAPIAPSPSSVGKPPPLPGGSKKNR